MSLEYEASSEPLHISAKLVWQLLTCLLSGHLPDSCQLVGQLSTYLAAVDLSYSFGLEMKELWDIKDFTIHEIQPITRTEGEVTPAEAVAERCCSVSTGVPHPYESAHPPRTPLELWASAYGKVLGGCVFL